MMIREGMRVQRMAPLNGTNAVIASASEAIQEPTGVAAWIATSLRSSR